MLRPSKRKIFVSISSLLILLSQLTAQQITEIKDSVDIPLSIKAGIDVFGPAMYFADRNILTYEGYLSVDLSEKIGISAFGGYADFKYSQYNYDYLTKGKYFKAGIDFNILKPEVSAGKYWGGIGIRYGISNYSYEIPAFSHENYWGTYQSFVNSASAWGHFLEVSPGFRAKIFSNLSMGWSIHLRTLLTSGTGKDLRPIYFPGFGKSDSRTSTGISYYFTWSFTYKNIRVNIKKDAPPPAENQATTGTTGGNNQ